MKKISMYLVIEGEGMDTKALEDMLNDSFSFDTKRRTYCTLKEEEVLKIQPKSLGRLRKTQNKRNDKSK